MNVDPRLTAMRDLIQQDIGQRGLARVPSANLLTAWPDDFAAACHSIAETLAPFLGVVTGFPIATADPPCGETDGPLGAVFLARALTPLGVRVTVFTDGTSAAAVRAGLRADGIFDRVSVCEWPLGSTVRDTERMVETMRQADALTHLIALERVGPGHTEQSIRRWPNADVDVSEAFEREVPPDQRGRCRSMRGRDLTEWTCPAHSLFEGKSRISPTTIGIGDGGNEIGMGKIRWDTIRRNIPNGGLIACRVPTDHLIVAGVSNWGAYALAAGVALLRGQPLPAELFDIEGEREILRAMVEQGPLVDGVTGKPTVSVDGLSFEEYAAPLRELGKLR